jgi:ABC-2 type transport system permease protein
VPEIDPVCTFKFNPGGKPLTAERRAEVGPGTAFMIEVVGTMAGMFGFALLMVWIAGRAFRAGALSDVKLSWKSFAGAIRGGGK